MQRMCMADPRGRHCFCIEVDPRSGARRCCRCSQWNIQGRDWTSDADFA